MDTESRTAYLWVAHTPTAAAPIPALTRGEGSGADPLTGGFRAGLLMCVTPSVNRSHPPDHGPDLPATFTTDPRVVADRPGSPPRRRRFPTLRRPPKRLQLVRSKECQRHPGPLIYGNPRGPLFASACVPATPSPFRTPPRDRPLVVLVERKPSVMMTTLHDNQKARNPWMRASRLKSISSEFFETVPPNSTRLAWTNSHGRIATHAKS